MPGRDGELFKDKIEVSLDGRQIFYLFFGGAVIACMVFVLGVMVGRRVEARAEATAPAADPARDPLAALDQLEVESSPELAFPAALRGGGKKQPLGAVDTALAQVTPPGDRAPGRDRQDVEPVLTEREASATGEDAADEAPPKPTARDKTERAGLSTPTAEAEAEDDPPARTRPADVADSAARFTLQLSSFQDRVEADAFFQEVKSAGYSPYIIEADVPDKGRWYRVRLGKYATYNDAVTAKQEFEQRQRIIAYVTRIGG